MLLQLVLEMQCEAYLVGLVIKERVRKREREREREREEKKMSQELHVRVRGTNSDAIRNTRNKT